MRAFVKSLAGLGLAVWLGGCAVGSFYLGRGTSTASAPPNPAAEPAATPAPGGYTPPQAHTAQVPAPHSSPPQAAAPQQDSQATAPSATYQPPAYQQQQPAQQQPPQQLPAGRAARTPAVPPPAEAEAEQEAMTTQRAREQCWMASENTKFARNLDQKVKYVEKCVNDKMRAAGQ
jgi:hypothetical protein